MVMEVNTKLCVLLTNDDGPPGKDSPYIFGFAKYLVDTLGWDVKVVIPSTQRSWIVGEGNAHHIKEIIKGFYYYPRSPDGDGDTSDVSRPLAASEFAEWILLDGTPATCANIALHNIFKDKIDLVISGPNYGRNSSAAFALSSGTIGAALSSSLSLRRSIALSYATVQHPVPKDLFEPAHALAARIIQSLWRDWHKDDGGQRNGEVDLYSINIPIANGLRDEKGLHVVWTRVWRNSIDRLFQPHAMDANATPQVSGPEAWSTPSSQSERRNVTSADVVSSSFLLDSASSPSAASISVPRIDLCDSRYARELVFKFAPNERGLIGPEVNAPPGTDAWAIERGMASITPLRASFAEAAIPGLSIAGHIRDNGAETSAGGEEESYIQLCWNFSRKTAPGTTNSARSSL